MKHGVDFNKIFAAFLVAALVAALSGYLSRQLVVETYPEKKGFAVAVTDKADAPAEAEKPAVIEPVDGLMATASAEEGQKITRVCSACHNFDKGGPNRVGPNLSAVFGNKQASHEGFAYSDALKAHTGTWTVQELNKFLASPRAYAPGTKMSFVGLSKPQDRANVITYLKSLAAQ